MKANLAGAAAGSMIARAMQKRDKNRVALTKSSCGAVMIDGLTFTVSVESDGAANNKGVILTLSGDAVENGEFTVDMIDVVYPAGKGTKTIKRKPELYKKKDGGQVYRLNCPEINIPECADPKAMYNTPRTEEQMMSGASRQIVFRFTPRCKMSGEAEIMINIYPAVNPLDGACTEWVKATADREFFEHGGLRKLMAHKR